MLEQAAGLPSRALEAIADLERRVVEADGGRLKLEWGRLRGRAGDRVEDLLWWDGDRLLGFLGLYGFGSTIELGGMVAPDARGRGIGGALVDAALPLCRERGARPVLLIVSRPSAAGKRLALRRGGRLDHSEHALVLNGDPNQGPHDPELSLRPATAADRPFVSRLLAIAFGTSEDDEAGDPYMPADSADGRTMVVEVSGSAVGALRITRNGDEAGIYGFAVEPSRQGRGIGRDALRIACEQLRSTGSRRIGLEVAVDNDRALGLYLSVGFTPVITEDYFALPLT